jgi:hypothetical protein
MGSGGIGGAGRGKAARAPHGAPASNRSRTGRVTSRFLVLAAYTAAIFLTLPYGPRIGLGFLRTGIGSFAFGWGIIGAAIAGALALLALLRRRGAPAWAYATLGLAAVGYLVAFAWLSAARLERVHLPEYGVAAFLAWRCMEPLVPGLVPGYVAGAVLAAAIGGADELLQSIVPGRVCDWRDALANALAAVLGMLVVATLRATRPLSDGPSSRR